MRCGEGKFDNLLRNINKIVSTNTYPPKLNTLTILTKNKKNKNFYKNIRYTIFICMGKRSGFAIPNLGNNSLGGQDVE